MTKSRFFLFLLLAFIAGVAIRSFIVVPVVVVWIVALASAATIVGGIARKAKSIVMYGFAVLFLLLGVFRFDYAGNSRPDLAPLYNELHQFKGVVWEEPEQGLTTQRLKLSVSEVDGHLSQPSFFVLATARRHPVYRLGDELKLEGVLAAPQNYQEFDYVSYLARQDVYGVISYPVAEKIGEGRGGKLKFILSRIKHSFEEKIDSSLPEPHASFMKGLLLGERESLPKDLVENFNQTGTSHIVALSGYNITLVGSFLMSLLLALTLPFNVAFWIAVVSVVLFVILVGASASVVRAGIMGVLVLVAKREGRMYRMTNALVFAAALMIFHNPRILRFDAAFELSFLATVGLIYFSPRLGNWFDRMVYRLRSKLSPGTPRDKPMPPLKEMLVQTLSAQLMVLPLLVYLFGRVSLVSPLANILVVVAVPYSMAAGFIAGTLGFVGEPLGRMAGWLGWILLEYKIRVIEFFASLPFASVNLEKWAVAPFILLYLLVFLMIRAFSVSRFKTKSP